MNIPELLAPAGNLEKLIFAVHYGADAVYIAGKKYGLRAFAGNFDLKEMEEGIRYAHAHHVKVYVTVNIFAHNADLDDLEEYLHKIADLQADAIIAADPGVIRIIRRTIPQMPIHISTQANNVNWSDVLFWQEYGGIERVVLARELTLDEIRQIKAKSPMPLEAFVHGAMCISYSGRCLLSHYMTDRDANKGECAQACRWNYRLVEEKRPQEYYPIEEDEKGTYIFNSQDMCLLPHLRDLVEVKLDSLKIEGRMKSLYYVATIIRAYRAVLDALKNDEEPDYRYWGNELEKISHRPYNTGFYYGRDNQAALTLNSSGYIKPYDFVGIVQSYDASTQIATIEQRNHFSLGDTLEFFGPNYKEFSQTIQAMTDKNDVPIEKAPNAQMIVKIKVDQPVYPLDLIRRNGTKK